MHWNWQLPDWPHFRFDPQKISQQERQFLLKLGETAVFLKSLVKEEYNQFVVEIMSTEGLESSKIEGEILDRESLRSSIQKHFGLKASREKGCSDEKEAKMAALLCAVYESFDKPLTHEMLWQWHLTLFDHESHISDCGTYRTHREPMQIVSTRYGEKKVFFEAPPSEKVFPEMNSFIKWFNSTKNSGSMLVRAAITHLYFESIHPFEDGNGRIGRALVEKVLSQEVGKPILLAVSKVLEKRKKEYYSALERCNKTLEVDHWIQFFAEAILQAQDDASKLLHFVVAKSKMFTTLSGKLNERQEKALLRMFAEGVSGFKGGLSAENYIAITKTSRATATRDLSDLVEKGALLKTGELRHTRYWLNTQCGQKA